MKAGFYPKLAWTGIRKNKQIYLPYLLTCIGMVMMYYIVSFLQTSSSIQKIPGGGTMQIMLATGTGVIGIFAAIFLFYSNTFLIRRRKKEFGLYNILGMGKGNLVKIQIWESLMIIGFTVSGGLIFGILFSKMAELLMINIMGGRIDFSFSVGMKSIRDTILLFVIIFMIIFLRNVSQIGISKPIELLHSENAGEKRPKANWILALLGIVILVTAYYLALTIEEPITAITMFFFAVVMVIVATYLLFIAGSVALCRLLQKNKRYYYQTKHFVTVGSMTYRMKRNGTGLASICILSTMVLVMLSSTICLYVGIEDAIRSRYPRDIVLDIYSKDDKEIGEFRDTVQKILQQRQMKPKNILEYNMVELAGYFSDGKVITDPEKVDDFSVSTYEEVRYFHFIPLEDYNRMMDQSETLSPGEAIVYYPNSEVDFDSIDIDIYGRIKVKKVVDDFVDNGNAVATLISSLYVITPDYGDIAEKLRNITDSEGNELFPPNHYYGFDLDASHKKQVQLYNQLYRILNGPDSGFPVVDCESAQEARGDYYGLYGGLFFLGILLGIVFVTATVLIMYYKQISEGYEDQARFEIMQKVGMTKREIRQSINSQVLTVFFMPLVTAGIHLAFAFPIISKLLVLFTLDNKRLLIGTTAGCYLVFALLYVIVYQVTSKAYYKLVSGKRERIL